MDLERHFGAKQSWSVGKHANNTPLQRDKTTDHGDKILNQGLKVRYYLTFRRKIVFLCRIEY